MVSAKNLRLKQISKSPAGSDTCRVPFSCRTASGCSYGNGDQLADSWQTRACNCTPAISAGQPIQVYCKGINSLYRLMNPGSAKVYLISTSGTDLASTPDIPAK